MAETGNNVVANVSSVRSPNILESILEDDEDFSLLTEFIRVLTQLLVSTLPRYVVLSDPLLIMADIGMTQPEIIFRASSIKHCQEFMDGTT